MKSTSILTLTFTILSTAIGCSGGAEGAGDRVKVYPVTGIVKVGGQPVEGASVTFSPRGDHPAAYARTNADGEYSLRTYDEGDGAAEGDYSVVITKSNPEAELDHSAAAKGGGGHSGGHSAAGKSSGGSGASGGAVPAMYSDPNSSGLLATVKSSGENKFDFDL